MSTETSAEQVDFCREMLGNRTDTLTIIKALRDRFGLDLIQAKEILVRAEHGVSLDEYQERFAQALEQIDRDDNCT